MNRRKSLALSTLLLIAFAPPTTNASPTECGVVQQLVELPASTAAHTGTGIKWEHNWPKDLFERAKKENRLVILDLEAIWCHWCHVMDEKTYADPSVQSLINSKFIAVKVDQDSRPDLSNRYEDYGWPATILFDSNGKELAKLSGYIPPEEMKGLLEAFIKDPTPGPSAQERPAIKYSQASSLPKDLRDELMRRHLAGFDKKYGSWGTFQKYLDWDSVEFSLLRAKEGDQEAALMAKKTLTGQLNLLDPVWGGVYQYSTYGDWKHPHFEKIMQFQGENLKVFSQGYSQFGDPAYLNAAEKIYSFLRNFLSGPEGAFYTSMDADIIQGQHSDWYYKLDDAGRRKHGVPRVDKNIYARENGWAINGVVALYAATGDKQYLDHAIKAADWILANRALPGGGFAHGSKNDAAPYLGDTVYMGRALLSLYAATGDRQWLKHAEGAADFIGKHFSHAETPGYSTVETISGGTVKSEPLLDENIAVARFTNLLYHYTGKAEYKKMSETAMRYLATPEIANKRRALVAGILLADREQANEPLHITVVGKKDDPNAQALFRTALKDSHVYKRTEWWDAREGALPHSDVELPELPEAAAFTCGQGRCSRPAKDPPSLTALLQKLSGDKPSAGE